MNNLTTRKIVLGMLMALVLAFSVQGIADALTFTTSRTGDLETVVPNEDFPIRFSARLSGPRLTDGYARIPRGDADIPVDTNLRETPYYEDEVPLGEYNGETPVSTEAAQNYDQEAINIAVTGPARITKVGTRIDVPLADSTDLDMYERTHEMYDSAGDHEKFSGSVSLILEPTNAAPGIVVIKITDTTADPVGAVTDPITFTVYIVAFNLDVTTTALSFSDLEGENYARASDQYDQEIGLTVTPASVPVNIEVVEGPGRLYVRKTYTDGSPASEGRANRELDISSTVGTSADTSGTSGVYLDANGGTNRITITVPDQEPVTAIYVYGRPSIQIVSGDDQTGAFEGRLEEPFVVRVNDERGRGVPMAIVTFSGGVTGSRFLPVPGTTVHVDAGDDWGSTYALTNDPVTATSIYR